MEAMSLELENAQQGTLMITEMTENVGGEVLQIADGATVYVGVEQGISVDISEVTTADLENGTVTVVDGEYTLASSTGRTAVAIDNQVFITESIGISDEGSVLISEASVNDDMIEYLNATNTPYQVVESLSGEEVANVSSITYPTALDQSFSSNFEWELKGITNKSTENILTTVDLGNSRAIAGDGYSPVRPVELADYSVSGISGSWQYHADINMSSEELNLFGNMSSARIGTDIGFTSLPGIFDGLESGGFLTAADNSHVFTATSSLFN
jgi:hypothetical protein